MRLNKLLLSTASAVLVLAAAGSANAAGFYIQEQSVSGQGASFAGAAAQPRDASVIFFNPAGMTHLEGGNAHLGVSLLVPTGDLKDTGTTLPAGAPASTGDGGNPYDPTPVPSGYITQQITNSFWVGFGVSAPFGLVNEYDEGWFGRYDSTETELITTDFTPSAAYKVNDWLSIGGSVIVQAVDAELKNNLYAGAEGTQTLDGDDISFGWKAGILAEPWQGTRIGLDYRSKIKHTLEGRLVIEDSGATPPNANIVGRADLNLPEIATFSVAQDVNEKLTLLGSATWFGWDSYDQIQVKNIAGGNVGAPVIQGYENTMAYAVGFDYKLDDAWTLRAGYQFDETPTTDEYRTSRTPDGDRHWFSAGGTYNLNDKWSFDFSGTYIDIEEETLDITRNTAPGVGALESDIKADTDGHVFIIGAGVNYKF